MIALGHLLHISQLAPLSKQEALAGEDESLSATPVAPPAAIPLEQLFLTCGSGVLGLGQMNLS